jgi:NAD(P)-dependent dehydrogenase (short-subunit alcohol dehydrogenase family)
MNALNMSSWFITGASRGLGLARAQAAIDAGEQVAATGRDPEAVRRAIGSDDDRLTCLALDVRDRAQVSEAVARAEATMGSIDVLVSNAGYSQMASSRRFRRRPSRTSTRRTCSER